MQHCAQLVWPQHAWIGTCCIDKASNAQMSETINPMLLWYRTAAVYPGYLLDFTSCPSTRPLPALSETVLAHTSGLSATGRYRNWLCPAKSSSTTGDGFNRDKEKSCPSSTHPGTPHGLPCCPKRPCILMGFVPCPIPQSLTEFWRGEVFPRANYVFERCSDALEPYGWKTCPFLLRQEQDQPPTEWKFGRWCPCSLINFPKCTLLHLAADRPTANDANYSTFIRNLQNQRNYRRRTKHNWNLTIHPYSKL